MKFRVSRRLKYYRKEQGHRFKSSVSFSFVYASDYLETFFIMNRMIGR